MRTPRNRRRGRDEGFTLLELLATVAVFGILVATGLPVVGGAMERFTMNSAARTVGAEVRSARYSAVAKNRTMAVRFNCPAPGQYRILEFTGIAAIDNAPDRCSPVTYPFPDATPGVAPDADGPVLDLPPGVRFRAVTDLQLNATGRINGIGPSTQLSLEVTNGRLVRTIAIFGNGRVLDPQ